MDGFVYYSDCSVKSTEFIGGAKQVSLDLWSSRNDLNNFSASPLNGEAAELWDKDPAEFKKKVLGRHRDIDDE